MAALKSRHSPIRDARVQKHMSQVALSYKSHVCMKTLSMIENDRILPCPHTMAALFRVLRCRKLLDWYCSKCPIGQEKEKPPH